MELGRSLRQLNTNHCYIENKRFALNNHKCGDFYFSSNFDSGNLGRVELCKDCGGIELPENAIHTEFDVWTVPDCYGTSNETPNRTWFYFSIKGGGYYQNVKINIKNLNRQAKLFSQGMAPVMKIGQNGHWHRIKDAPTHQNEDEHFVISFIHKVHNHPDIEVFYAFTYPFAYKDCLNLLSKFDEKYLKNNEEIDLIIKQIYKKIPIDALLPNIESLVKKQISNGNLACYSSSTNCIKDFEALARKELQNEIYYHRELLIKSLEGRRVDLITITSYHGIQGGLERKLDNLFPDPGPRCHAFKNKKVIFLSSRVHPGETPASFVLNGFLNLILDRKNPVSITLRRMYVFKIVPILNPDGVYHGFYRTDTLGQNLNRMYMDTKIEYHPSIFAVKKLIKFYQNGASGYPDMEDIVCDIKSSSLNMSTERQENCEIGNDEIELETDEESGNTTLTNLLKTHSESCSSTGSDNIECSRETNSTRQIIANELSLRAGEEENTTTKKLLTQLYVKKNGEPKIIKKSSMKAIAGASSFSSNRSSDIKNKDNTVQTRTIVKKSIIRRIDSKQNSTNVNSNESTTIPLTKIISMSQNKGKMKTQIKNANNTTLLESGCSSSNVVDGGNNLFLYIDMHGHASKKGVFMYGNHFTNLGQAVECMLLPKLMTINSQHFHFDACNFSEKNMYKKEKRDGLSKEGSGRVTIYKMTGLVKCYTLECNYNCGKYVNILPSRNNVYSKQTLNALPPKYTPSTYEEVGRALGPSILDLTNSNSASRLPNTEYRTLQGVRSSLRYDVDRSIHNKPNTANITSKISSKRRSNISSSNPMALTSKKETAKENYREVLSRWNAGNDVPACSSSHNNSSINTHLQQPQQCKSSSKLTLETSKLSSSSSSATTTTTVATAAVTKVNSKLITKTLKKSNSYKIRSTCCVYGKKDSSSSIMKKKAKILVESSNAGSGETTSSVAVMKKDHHHHHQPLQKKSNAFSTNVPNKRIKVTLKAISTATSNNSITNLSNAKDKKLQQKKYFQMQANQSQQNQIANNVSSCTPPDINQISSIGPTIDNVEQQETIPTSLCISASVSSLSSSLSPISSTINLLNQTYMMSQKPSSFLLIEANSQPSSSSSLSSSSTPLLVQCQVKQNNDNNTKSEPFELLSETQNISKNSNIIKFIDSKVKFDTIKKSSSTDSGLCSIYKNSFYRTNSNEHLPSDTDNINSIEINTTALIKPDNYNINSNINNFIIPSCSTTINDITIIPPNTIISSSDNDNNKSNKTNTIGDTFCTTTTTTTEKAPPLDDDDADDDDNNDDDDDGDDDDDNDDDDDDNDNQKKKFNCNEFSLETKTKLCKKKFSSSSSSLPLVTMRRKIKLSKSESMIYKSKTMRKDANSNKKIIRNYFCATLDNTKLKKKRSRGFDSITIKHKKNKIRNTKRF